MQNERDPLSTTPHKGMEGVLCPRKKRWTADEIAERERGKVCRSGWATKSARAGETKMGD